MENQIMNSSPKRIQSRISQNKISIQWQEISGSMKASASFSSDQVTSITSGLIENIHDFHHLIETAKDDPNQVHINQQGNLVFKFNYQIGKAQKQKQFIFQMTKTQLSFENLMQKENIQLKARVKQLETKVQSLQENHKSELKKVNGTISSLNDQVGECLRKMNQLHQVSKCSAGKTYSNLWFHPNWLLSANQEYIHFQYCSKQRSYSSQFSVYKK